ARARGLRGNKDPSSNELFLERFLLADSVAWNQRQSEHRHRTDTETATPIHCVPPPDHSKGAACCNKSGALICGILNGDQDRKSRSLKCTPADGTNAAVENAGPSTQPGGSSRLNYTCCSLPGSGWRQGRAP